MPGGVSVSAGGCLPRGSAGRCLSRGVSAQWGCLPRGRCPHTLSFL